MFPVTVVAPAAKVPATVVLPDDAATVNLLVLTSKSPSTPTAPLALIAAAVVVPATLNVLSSVVAPVTSRVPAISILVSNLALVTTSSAKSSV